MPYILPEPNREVIDPNIQPLAEQITNVGDLNYAITRLVGKFLLANGLKYDNVNAVAGVLQKVLAEFDARVTRPYEDLKIFQNGDIPEYSEIGGLIREMKRALPAVHVPDTIQVHG